MEPFRLRLERLTFTDPSLNPQQQQPPREGFDSFSTVVSYDSQFVEDESVIPDPDHAQLAPLTHSPQTCFSENDNAGHSFSNTSVISSLSSSSLTASANQPYRLSSQHGEEGIINIGYQLNFTSPLVRQAKPCRYPSIVCTNAPGRLPGDESLPVEITSNQQHTQTIKKPANDQLSTNITRPETDASKPERDLSTPEADVEPPETHAGVHTPLDLVAVNAILDRIRASVSSDRSERTTGSPSLENENQNSFNAFTSTTEALALQKSVIGSSVVSVVQPACAEDIARALALTQQKLNQSDSDSYKTEQIGSGDHPDTVSPPPLPSTEQNNRHHLFSSPTDKIPLKYSQFSSRIASAGEPGQTVPLAPPSVNTVSQTKSELYAKSTPIFNPVPASQTLRIMEHTSGQTLLHSNGAMSPTASTAHVQTSRTSDPHPTTSRQSPVSVPGSKTGQPVQLLIQTSVQSSQPELIVIPNSDLTITKEPSRVVKTYLTPSEEMKNKLRAKAKLHGKSLSSSKRTSGSGSKRRESPSEHGEGDPEEGRSTPTSESGSDVTTAFKTLTVSDSSLKNDDLPTVAGSSRASRPLDFTLNTSDLINKPRPQSSSTPANTPGKIGLRGDLDVGSGAIDKLVREKAHLEGQIEMLKIEAQTAIRERSDLQSQLSAFKTQFKSSSGSGKFRDRESLISDLQNLKVDRDKLYAEVQGLQKSLDEQHQDYSMSTDDLDHVRSENQSLRKKTSEDKKDLVSKDSELEELKNRYSAVFQELHTFRQERRTMENTVRSVQNEISALTKTKTWYQQQLKNAQETRTQLQKEVSKMQMSAMEQSSNAERLKTDNAHLKQQLAEGQQRALQEKEMLVKHLERIEADMLEREAAVQQLQTDQAQSEGSLHEKIRISEEEKHQLRSLVMTAHDLESEVAKLKNDVSQKDAHINRMEHDHAQMMKQLTLAQELTSQKDKDMDGLQSRFVEMDAKAKRLLANTDDKDTEILAVKDQKVALEVALSSANEEKREIDTALEILRDDMEKVEASFRTMSLEMTRKNENLNVLMGKNASLERDLYSVNQQFSDQQKSVAVNKLALDEAKINENELIVTQLQKKLADSQKETEILQGHLAEANVHVKDLDLKLTTSHSEKVFLEANLNQAHNTTTEMDTVKAEIAALNGQIQELNLHHDSEITKKLSAVEILQADLFSVREHLDDVKARHAEEMRLVGDRLREASETQHKAEWKVTELNRQLALGAEHDEQNVVLHQHIEDLTSKGTYLESDRDRLQTDLATLSQIAQTDADKYNNDIDALRRELTEASRTLDEYKVSKDESLRLSLDLEREKGRLSGVLQSHAALKQHTSDLEEALAEKESSLVDISTRTQQKLNEMSCHSNSTSQKMSELEQSARKGEENIRELKKQIGSEKLQTSKFRKKNESMKSELTQLRHDLDDSKQNLTTFKQNSDVTTTKETSLNEELLKMRAECDILRTEVDSLRRQLEETREKDPMVEESLKNLQWEIGQKQAELEGWKDQVKLVEQRQELEMDSVRKALQGTKEEVDKLRADLAKTRKDKFTYQAKLSELRGTVKACLRGSLDADGVAQDQTTAMVNGAVNSDGSDPQASLVNDSGVDHLAALRIIDRILDDTSTPEYDSKPLAALHHCMASLRNQMSGLQQEIDHHSMAVLNTSQSWKQVEYQVKELRDLCSSDECSVRSDTESGTSNQSAEDLVDKLIKHQNSENQNSSQVVTDSTV